MNVGIYHPEFWIRHGHWDYLNQTKGNSGYWHGITYRINDFSVREADVIVIHENIDNPITLKSFRECIMLVTGEEKSVCDYHPDYINQFDCIITSRTDIVHPNIIRTHYLHPWRVKKTYDQLSAITAIDKDKSLSAIISNLTTLPIQKDRVHLMKKLVQHYGDSMAWFSKGNGDPYLNDKWDGLAKFKYSIAIENSQHSNYFTEKISDCFLAYTVPVYFGCPNIEDYFDQRSFIKIDVKDWKSAIQIIDTAMQEDFYLKNQKYLNESRKLVLEKYHFIAALTDILKKYSFGKKSVSRTIKPQSYFLDGKIKRLIKKSLAEIKDKIIHGNKRM